MRIIPAFILLALATNCLADAAASQKLTNQLQALESLQGEFEQVVSDKKGATLQKSSGTFTIKRPGYFYWESKAPYEQVVIGNPQKLWVYDSDLDQVTVKPQASNKENSPARLLSGDFASQANQFDVTEKKQDKKEIFTLVPKNKNAENFSQIQFGFSEGKLTSLAFIDKLNQQTSLDLRNTKSNVNVDLKMFTFEPKPGTDIIEND